MKNIIFISKDALNKHVLPTYGNKFWKTPNIDALAEKGTVFNRHYTAAGSTAMAFTAMALGKYCYETGRRVYKNETTLNGNTLFDKIYAQGYECHIMWDDTYTSFAESHFKCQGEHTVIHSLPKIKQAESAHVKGKFDDVSFNDTETAIALDLIKSEFETIQKNAIKPIFLWFHLPHVMRGRQGYGSDIDVFDAVIGYAREIFGDDDIFVSADHGHMNGWKNKYHYGFDVGEEAICIPLIAPKINDSNTIDFPTSTIQTYDILFERKVAPLPYVMCETAYYAQPKRKIAIISGKYKYCYDKETKKECLYDLEFDPEENHNLVYPEFYDTDRFLWYSTAQCFYYPYWGEAQNELVKLRGIKNEMWKNGKFFEELYNKFMHRLKCLYTKIKLAHPSDDIKNNGK
ncbi:MAG: sulfatase-like hydrolase/transferase [Eubacteriales bacterium]|nr:sulfatase-like hydrolase/transferase [Eubacteriales bacterium]